MGGQERRLGAFEFLAALGLALVLVMGASYAAGIVGDSSAPVGCHSAPVGDHSAPVGEHSAPCPEDEDDPEDPPDDPEPVDFDERRISFQPRKAEIPDGYEVDSGRAYSDVRGYGWRLAPNESSGRQCGDRNAISNQAHDTFCHAQGRYDFINGHWQWTRSDAHWELAVPNGVYEVTLTVGESRYIYDDSNTFSVEGVDLDPFYATKDNRQRTTMTTVTVRDGFLTINPRRDSQGKIAAVSVALAEPSQQSEEPSSEHPPSPPPAFETPDVMRFNFVSRSGATPSDWVAQNGMPYDEIAGHGWRAPDGGPVERRQCGVRNTTNSAVRDSFCHAQTRYVFSSNTWTAVDSPAIFEVAVEPGAYRVAVSVGDPKYFINDVRTSVTVEGALLIGGFIGRPARPLAHDEVIVNVDDGHLTIDPTAGTKGKLNYVTIERLPEPIGVMDVRCVQVRSSTMCDNVAPRPAGQAVFDISRAGVRLLSCFGSNGYEFTNTSRTRCVMDSGQLDMVITNLRRLLQFVSPCAGVEVGRASFLHEPSNEVATFVMLQAHHPSPCFAPTA